MINVNEERYMEEISVGIPYREKQIEQFEALIAQLRQHSIQQRKQFFQPSFTSVAAYEEDVASYREQVKGMLGWPLGVADHSAIPEATITFVAEDGLGTIHRVEVDAGYGLTTYGLLFLPEGEGPHPLVISQHGGGGTPELCSGLQGLNNYNDMTRRVLEQGIAVFAPQLVLWGEEYGPAQQRNHYDHQLKHLGSSIAAVEIYKIQRALDYLISRDDIDGSKVGMIGLSYGGFYTLFTAALEPRINAAYSSCFINDRFKFDWPDFTWFNAANRFFDAEIAALIAPRFLFLEVGVRDELFLYEYAQPEIDKVAAYYRNLKLEHRFSASAFDGVHELNPDNAGIERFCQVVKGISGIDAPELRTERQEESFVFTDEEPLPLRRKPLPGIPLRVFKKGDVLNPEVIEYKEGMDYIYDAEQGTLQRTTSSRIANWSDHPLSGIKRFDHTQYEDYSNRAYTVYAEYIHESSGNEIDFQYAQRGFASLFPQLTHKLKAGEEAIYAVLGDSISTGGEASEQRLAFYHLFADYVEQLFPGGSIRIINQAIGGEMSSGGVERAEQDIVSLQPDIVSIGYGMNDQNLFDHGVATTPADYEQNMIIMIEQIKASNPTDLILVTPCEPNPEWQHTSGRMSEYVSVLQGLGAKYAIGVADVHTLWQQELAAGKTPSSLLFNNINHPNDYGHYIYFKAFEGMLIRAGEQSLVGV